VPARARTVGVSGTHGFIAFDFKAAIVYELRRSGRRVVVAPGEVLRLDGNYAPDDRRLDGVVYVYSGPHPRTVGRVVAQVTVGAHRKVTVTYIRAARLRARAELPARAPAR
jgi:hypothetical protein